MKQKEKKGKHEARKGTKRTAHEGEDDESEAGDGWSSNMDEEDEADTMNESSEDEEEIRNIRKRLREVREGDTIRYEDEGEEVEGEVISMERTGECRDAFREPDTMWVKVEGRTALQNVGVDETWSILNREQGKNKNKNKNKKSRERQAKGGENRTRPEERNGEPTEEAADGDPTMGEPQGAHEGKVPERRQPTAVQEGRHEQNRVERQGPGQMARGGDQGKAHPDGKWDGGQSTAGSDHSSADGSCGGAGTNERGGDKVGEEEHRRTSKRGPRDLDENQPARERRVNPGCGSHPDSNGKSTGNSDRGQNKRKRGQGEEGVETGSREVGTGKRMVGTEGKHHEAATHPNTSKRSCGNRIGDRVGRSHRGSTHSVGQGGDSRCGKAKDTNRNEGEISARCTDDIRKDERDKSNHDTVDQEEGRGKKGRGVGNLGEPVLQTVVNSEPHERQQTGSEKEESNSDGSREVWRPEGCANDDSTGLGGRQHDPICAGEPGPIRGESTARNASPRRGSGDQSMRLWRGKKRKRVQSMDDERNEGRVRADPPSGPEVRMRGMQGGTAAHADEDHENGGQGTEQAEQGGIHQRGGGEQAPAETGRTPQPRDESSEDEAPEWEECMRKQYPESRVQSRTETIHTVQEEEATNE